MLAAVPSPSFSSLVILSPHSINSSKPAVLPIKVPLSADTEGLFNTESASSQVSESRNNPPRTVAVVRSHTATRSKGPALVTSTRPFKCFGPTVQFAEIVGKGSPSERTSFFCLGTLIFLCQTYQSSLTVTSRSLSRFPDESIYNVSSAGVKPNSWPSKAVFTERNSDVTPVITSFFRLKQKFLHQSSILWVVHT